LVQFIKDTENDIIVGFNDGHKFRIIAKGAEQKLRGLIWNGSRPDIILCDDMENDELVMNKDRREKMKRWFKGALLPCISDRGIVRMVGTILHMDSLLENIMPKENDKQTVNDGLKTYSTARTRCGKLSSIVPIMRTLQSFCGPKRRVQSSLKCCTMRQFVMVLLTFIVRNT
jgi:hypothetical protein